MPSVANSIFPLEFSISQLEVGLRRGPESWSPRWGSFKGIPDVTFKWAFRFRHLHAGLQGFGKRYLCKRARWLGFPRRWLGQGSRHALVGGGSSLLGWGSRLRCLHRDWFVACFLSVPFKSLSTGGYRLDLGNHISLDPRFAPVLVPRPWLLAPLLASSCGRRLGCHICNS